MLGRESFCTAGALAPGNHTSFKGNVPPWGMIERFPPLYLFNYKSKYPPIPVLPASRSIALAFSGAVNIPRKD